MKFRVSAIQLFQGNAFHVPTVSPLVREAASTFVVNKRAAPWPGVENHFLTEAGAEHYRGGAGEGALVAGCCAGWVVSAGSKTASGSSLSSPCRTVGAQSANWSMSGL